MASACSCRWLVRMGILLAVLATVFGGLPSVPAPAQAAERGLNAATQKLFAAVHGNDLQGVQASVAAGADLDARDRWGMSAIELAIDKGYFSIAHFLTSTRSLRRYPPTQAAVDPSPRARPAQSKPTVSSPDTSPAAAPEAPKPRPASNAASGERLPAASSAAGEGSNPFDPQRTVPGAKLPVVSSDAASARIPTPPPSPEQTVPAAATVTDEGAWANSKSPGFALTDEVEPPITRPTPRPAPPLR